MTTKCFTPVRGKRIRVTKLDECGNVPAAEAVGAFVSTDGFVTVTLSAQVEDGAEIITKKADGSLCVNEKYADSFKRFDVTMEFCGVDPGLLSLVTNAEPYANAAADVVGITVAEGEIATKFAFELWTGLANQACEAGGATASGYMLLPFVAGGHLGDIAIASDAAVTFSLDGAHTKGSNTWGAGPYLVINDDTSAAAVLPTELDPDDHLLLVQTSVAPPDAACGLQDMPAAIT